METCLTPIYVDNGHLFLAQSRDSHRMLTSPGQASHFQLSAVMNL